MNRSPKIISLLLLLTIAFAPLSAQTTAPVAAPKTVAELQTRNSQILAKPELAPATIGVKVSSLESGRVLFEANADKLLRPASNMKIYTIATALDRLTPDYHLTT